MKTPNELQRNLDKFAPEEMKCSTCENACKSYYINSKRIYNCETCIKERNRKNELTRLNKFYASLERVSRDLDVATVSSYNPSTPTQEKAKETAIQFIRNFEIDSKSLVLSGTPGLGKSHLAYAVAKEIREKRHKVLFIKSSHLLQTIRESYRSSSIYSLHLNTVVDESVILRMIEELDLLVIDDIGSEYVKSDEFGYESWASDILFKVYDSRLGKSTISTTNYISRELEKKYGNNGARIVDRMLYSSLGIRLDGESYRRR